MTLIALMISIRDVTFQHLIANLDEDAGLSTGYWHEMRGIGNKQYQDEDAQN
jgi:hypothetical protein